MPELPEVEHLRRTLAKALVGRRVAGVILHRPDICHASGRTPSSADLLVGGTFIEPLRRGKQLALRVADGRLLCVHLGMSGQLLHIPCGELPAKPDHIHATWELGGGDRKKRKVQDGGRLIFRDPRRFGGIWAFPSEAALVETRWRELGPDALAIETEALGAALTRTARPVKAALLDQSLLAGVGNIYADEALFLAGVRPERPAHELKPTEVDRLAGAIRSTLARAIEAGGSTLRDYLDAGGNAGAYQHAHQVYGRGGHPCRTCGRTLRTTLLAQRTTVFCSGCQR